MSIPLFGCASTRLTGQAQMIAPRTAPGQQLAVRLLGKLFWLGRQVQRVKACVPCHLSLQMLPTRPT